MSGKLEKIVKISVLSVMVFLIAIAGFSYAYFNPTISGNESASSMKVVTKKIPPHPLYGVLQELAEAGTYASTYSNSDTNDSYGKTSEYNVYYIRTSTQDNETQANTLLNKINVKFAGFCWQMLRTTDTGGVKLIYNGKPDGSGHCLSQNTTTTYKGPVGTSGAAISSYNASYMYADSFTYDGSTGKFTLVNPTVSNWSTNKNLIGKYTCKTSSSTSTCTTLYYLSDKDVTDSNKANNAVYTIGNVRNSEIGTSAFNGAIFSPVFSGYKYDSNSAYALSKTASAPANGSIMGKDVSWNGSNYVLKDGSSNSTHKFSGTYEANYHYTCATTSATCTNGKVRYYIEIDYYIELENGETIETALEKMETNSANTQNSAMKTYIENWYQNNLTSFESYLDQDAVYCNDRSITSLGGWSKTGTIGSNSSSSSFLIFTSYNGTNKSLNCANVTDKFSTSNPHAQLKYPIGLATAPEFSLINNTYVVKTGDKVYTMSARYMSHYGPYNAALNDTGAFSSTSGVTSTYGVRPVIVLKPSKATITGDGSLNNPYVIN